MLSLVLAGCGTPATATPGTIIQTVEVPVIQTQEVLVGVTPQGGEKTSPVVEEYPRSETLYVSGAAWGPATTWNPFQPASLGNSAGTIGYVYETLFGYNPLKDQSIPWLAESGGWADEATYQVTLRSGLTWTDGAPLTAADVAFTYELGRQDESLWFAPMWRYLTGVTARDDTHLVFSFKDPLYQEFEANLTNIPIVPKHLWQGRSADEIRAGKNETPVGSGAYLYEQSSEDRNVWRRNEKWWGIDVFGKPAPKYIVDIHTSSNDVALGMVLNGNLDLSNNYLAGIGTLVNQGYVRTYYSQSPYMLAANTAILFLNPARKPLDDADFRKALAYAIDVPSIVETAYGKLVRPADPSGLLPSLGKYIDAGVVGQLGFSYDPEKARHLLSNNGYKDLDDDGFVEAPDGSRIELSITCPNGWTDWMAAIDIIAASAQAVGINLHAETPDHGAWNIALQSGDFDMTMANGAPLSNTPWSLYNRLFNHPIREQMQVGNYGRYDNPALFDLVDALARVKPGDVEGMKAVCSQIQSVMLSEMPVIPLWYDGLWAQWSNAVWTNWPTETSPNQTLPATWSGYLQLSGLNTLINLQPAGN